MEASKIEGEAKKSEGIPDSAIECLLSGKMPAVPKWLVWAVAGFVVSIPLLHFFSAWFTQMTPILQRHLALTLIIVSCFLMYPLGRKSWKDKLNWKFAIDVLLILATVVPLIFIAKGIERYTWGVGFLTPWEIVCGTATIAVVIEATRRTVGWPLVIIVFIVLAHCMFGEYFPGLLRSPGVPWHRLVGQFYLETYGIYGLPMGVVTSFLIMFFIFISCLKVSGGAQVFTDLACSIVGRFSGGPAKVAVVASSLLGSATGSPMANVAGTGAFTIPLMKQTGFTPRLAAAVEASSSTGGQFVPPLMGITAFLIAAFTGIPYIRICLAGLIPAFLFYLAIFLSVHFEAKKLGLGGMAETPKFLPTLAKSWLVLIPIGILVSLLVMGYPLARIGFWATISIVVCTAINAIAKRGKLSPVSFLMAFEEAGRMSITVGIACAAAGLISGIFYASGLGDNLAFIIGQISGGQLGIVLVLTAVLAILLGMGMPSPPLYVIMFVSLIPLIEELGVATLPANFFVFFIGVASGITPPVCLTAFVAASIAGSGMMRTGFTAMRLSYVAYLGPVLFVMYPELLCIGSPLEIVTRLVFVAIGTAGLTAGLSGWFLRKTGRLERVTLIIGAVLAFLPGLVFNTIGVALVFGILFLQRRMPQGLSPTNLLS